MDKKWEDFAKEFEPKFRLQWLYDLSEEKEAIEIKIDEPAEDSNSIYVKATSSVYKKRVELVVDRKTKLIKKLSLYHLRENGDKFYKQVEFLAYNQPIDPSVFELRGIPDNAKVYDQVDRLVGLEKGDLTNKEIAAKVVREGLEATIAKDYDEVSRLMEGDPGDTIEEFIEKEFEARLVRVVSIGQPETHEKNEFFVYVPCEIEVENEERRRWIVNIIATAKAIEYQDDRWIMHTDLRASEPYILSTSTLSEQDRIEGNIIVPGLRVGDYNLGISKDEVLRKLGEPENIFYEGERYTLGNLPEKYYMSFGDISFLIHDDIVKEIGVLSPLYKFTNGLGVGDSEQKIKQAFGDDFHLKEGRVKDFLTYEDKGLKFEIYTMNRMLVEIGIYKPTGDHIDSDTTDSGKSIMLSEQSPGPITFPKIDRRPKPEMDEPREMNTLPKYDPDSTNPFQMDLRCRDLSKLDLSNSIDDLLYATFDDRTVWPTSDKMPYDFTWQKFTELGKNPGLGIRSLHKKGITGHGVNIAILDQPLLVDHQEYAERLRLYEEIHIQSGTEPQMHGPAVASIAVGKTVGVAPEAELYYIAQWNFDWEKEHAPTLRYLAQGIHRILEVNEQLPKDKKIRVISISKGWTRSHKEYRLITEAAQKARAAGMLVVCTSIELVHDGFDFGGLGRSPLADPDVFESYNAGLFMDRAFRGNVFSFPEGNIWVPMDSRTTASPTGCDEYVFYRQGGFSWAVPYIAGVYALAAQVEPDISPERFWNLAMRTGRTIELEHKGQRRSFGPIIDPVKLISAISDDEAASQQASLKNTIVPGQRVGDYTFDMSKDEVLRMLGEPKVIFGGGERYTLNNLPRRYFMVFDDVSFQIEDDSVKGITVLSPFYKFTNGLGVGDSEQKIKKAFGDDFHYKGADFLAYEDKGLTFEINNEDRTVEEINVYRTTGDHEEGENDTSDINRKIAQICTGPADFNDVITIFGQPSDYKWSGQSFKLEDLPVERYWIWYPDSIHIFMKWDKVDMLEIVDSAYVFNGKIPMGSSLERVLSIVGQPKETVVGLRGWEDGVLYKDINGRVGWSQYRREDLNADFRFLNNTLKCVHILEIKGSSATAGRAAKRGSFQTVKTIKSVNEFDDVRWKDISKLDLSKKKGLVSTLKFNQKTVWPEQAKLPTSCDPDKFLKEGMNPGLGIRKLHKQGIIGKGVNVAIIDQPMYLDHPEFAGKIVSYHDVGCGSESSMHGPAVTSLLVGTNCGTAPGARVYYVAAPSWTKDAAFQAEALYWIIEQNEQLPKEKKIRVVSVSAAPSGPGSPFDKHNKMWDRACERAENAGILVLDCTSHRGFIGACWYDATDPENAARCTPGFRGRGGWDRPGCILVPTSPRTTAEEYNKGEFGYQYCGRGGLSWAIPYCTGVLALGWQVNQELSSGQMRDLLFQSAYINDDGTRIINPEGFIQLVKKAKVDSSTRASR